MKPILRKEVHEGPAIDPLVALLPIGDVSWILPGPIALELGGTPIPPPASSDPIPVAMIEDRGSQVRVGIRLEHARFAVWTEQARLLAVVARTEVVRSRAGDLVDGSQGKPAEASLKPGARVRRLAHEGMWTRVRYLGEVELEGWVRDAALADRGPPGNPIGRVPTGRQVQMVKPGDPIRAEPRSAGRALAVMASGYFVDTLSDAGDGWLEVSYEDGAVAVHGYWSAHDVPSRLHGPHPAEAALPPVAPNATVASGTCLYARENGEAIGYVVGDRQVYLEPADTGWYSASIDTPWGAIAFAVQGATETDLAACAPPGSLPLPPLPPPSVP